jgi:hypothetical protein
MIDGMTNKKLYNITKSIIDSFERPTILITPNSKDLDSTLNISKLYIRSTEILNSKSITRLKISCKNVTDK